MPATLIELWLTNWAHQRDYAVRLVSDLSDEEMVAQPVPGVVMNHPAWVRGHLSAYPPVLCAMLRRRTPKDPKDHPFGRESKPETSLGVYGSKDEVVGEYLRVHDDLAETIAGADIDVLDDAIRLERWRDRFPRLKHACAFLMTTHEGIHLGQLSAWRRAGVRPSV